MARANKVLTGPVPWADILDHEFVYERQCWRSCGGGYCCSNDIPGVHFQLIVNHGANLVFLEQEYEFIKSQGKCHDSLPDSPLPQSLSLDFGGPRPLRVIQLPCRLGGRCDGVVVKPLLCRLYPFVPIFDIDGNLDAIYPASIFELTDQLMGWSSHCPVNQEKHADYWRRWENDDEALAMIRHPYLMFHLGAYRIIADTYRRMLPASDRLKGLEGPDFWHRWELEYLGGALFDWDEIRTKTRELYSALADRYGDIL